MFIAVHWYIKRAPGCSELHRAILFAFFLQTVQGHRHRESLAVFACDGTSSARGLDHPEVWTRGEHGCPRTRWRKAQQRSLAAHPCLRVLSIYCDRISHHPIGLYLGPRVRMNEIPPVFWRCSLFQTVSASLVLHSFFSSHQLR